MPTDPVDLHFEGESVALLPAEVFSGTDSLPVQRCLQIGCLWRKCRLEVLEWRAGAADLNRRESKWLPAPAATRIREILGCESRTTKKNLYLNVAQVSPCSTCRRPADRLWNLRADSICSPQFSVAPEVVFHAAVQTHRPVAAPDGLVASQGKLL